MIGTVASVMHTGTHTVRAMLGALGSNWGRWAHHHFDWPVKKEPKEGLVVVPIRDPRETLKSWLKRGRDISLLDVSQRRLMAFCDRMDPFYMPIDRPDRDVYRTRLQSAAGIKVMTAWPRLHHIDGEPDDYDIDVPEDVRGWYSERFGYET